MMSAAHSAIYRKTKRQKDFPLIFLPLQNEMASPPDVFLLLLQKILKILYFFPFLKKETKRLHRMEDLKEEEEVGEEEAGGRVEVGVEHGRGGARGRAGEGRRKRKSRLIGHKRNSCSCKRTNALTALKN